MTSSRLMLLGAAAAALVLTGCASAITGAGSAASTAATPSSSGSSGSPAPGSSSGSTRPVISFRALSGQTTSVDLTPEFVAALTATRITPGTAGTAHVQGSQLQLPVSGGNLTIYRRGSVDPFLQGRVEHVGGGFSLTAGGNEIALVDLVVDFDQKVIHGDVTVNGKSVGTSIDLFRLDLAGLSTPSVAGSTATLSGADVSLTPLLARALNTAFTIHAFAGGLKIGTMTSVVTGTS